MPKKKSVNPSQSSEYDDTPAVDVLIEAMSDPVRVVVSEIRKLLMNSDRRITEGVKWNSPSFYWNGWFATVNSRNRAGVMLVLHHGSTARSDSEVRSAVSDATHLLKWHSADRASATIAGLQELQELRPLLSTIIKQWATYHSAMVSEKVARSKGKKR